MRFRFPYLPFVTFIREQLCMHFFEIWKGGEPQVAPMALERFLQLKEHMNRTINM